MIASSFIPVEGGDFKISDIQVTGAGGYGDVSMQGMESDGSFNENHYYYLTMDGIGVEDGWYRDIDGSDPIDETDYLAPGEAFCFHADTDVTIAFSKVID